ncbi:MAG: PD-(D/E)XK nuclease family transposase [Firmicutes bacterium]|nr:PD-(D/E)XK nuclease family transposase [Bacillota bacterium]
MSDNPLENLNLTNNFMFVKTFSQADIFEQTTTLLLGEKVTVPDKNLVEYEKISEIKYTKKGVRYDVKLGNSDKLVDMEMERILRTDDPLDKRASLYSAHMIVNSLEKGQHYKDKKDTHTIFMCDFKPFEVDSYKYDAKYVCKTSDKGIYVPYDTGDHHYFFNMTYDKDDIPKELKELFVYIKDTQERNVPENSALINKISERVKFIRNSESIKEEYNMLNLYENEIYADALSKGEQLGEAKGILLGEAKGKLEGKLFTLISLVRDGIIESSVAAKRLNISEENFLSKMKEAETTIQS